MVAKGAADQFSLAVEAKADELRKAHKEVPTLGNLQAVVAKENPELYAEYVEEIRDISRGLGR